MKNELAGCSVIENNLSMCQLLNTNCTVLGLHTMVGIQTVEWQCFNSVTVLINDSC